MTELRKVLFTFDYELFLGKKSGTIDKCVIQPTARLLNILKEHNAKAIFFVDSLWLSRLKDSNALSAIEDFKKVSEQIQEVLKQGHYVFSHIHPHWLDAAYIEAENQWKLTNYSKYRFGSLNATEKEDVFTRSFKVLKEIIEPVAPGYLLDGYRAGGWSIQPFEDFKPYFEKYGIKYDFSVLPGMKYTTKAQEYDFSNVVAKEPYKFANDPTLLANGKFVEFPISTITLSAFTKLFNRILLKYLWKTNNRSIGDGIGISAESVGESIKTGEMISIELLTGVKLSAYLSFLDNHNYMQFISHPKMLSEHNINTFVSFLKKAYSKYTIETDFRKMLPE